MKQQPVNIKKTIKRLLSIFVVIAAFYFYMTEIGRHAADLNHFKVSINIFYLLLALFVSLLANIFEAVIWKTIIRMQDDRRAISFQEIIAILFASSIFKYLPGFVWTFTAQILWLKKYGFNKTLILYINLVCVMEGIILALYLTLIYSGMYTNTSSTTVILPLAILLIFCNIVFNCCSSAIVNKAITVIARFTKTEVQPVTISKRMMFVVQSLFTFSWILTGVAVFFASKGIGLNLIIADTIPILASMSISWLAGYLAVITPGGLGVREGVMLLLLKPVLAVQAALLLPIVTRVMLFLSEALLGLLALFFGIRHNVFSWGKNDGV